MGVDVGVGLGLWFSMWVLAGEMCTKFIYVCHILYRPLEPNFRDAHECTFFRPVNLGLEPWAETLFRWDLQRKVS